MWGVNMDRLKRQKRTATLNKQHLLSEIDAMHDKLFTMCMDIIDEDDADEATQIRTKLEQALASVHDAYELAKVMANNS